MSEIKMSEVFDLPLTSGEAFCYDAQNSSVLYMDNSSQGTKKPRAIATVKAINAYDANQVRIAELEAALQEVIYHFESGNGDHSDLNDGMIPKLKELINGQWSETKCET